MPRRWPTRWRCAPELAHGGRRRRTVNQQRSGSHPDRPTIRTLAHFGITGHRVAGAPGIYVRLDDPASHAALPQRPQRRLPGSAAPQPDFTGLGKIAALGIKVSRHCSYHGLALNVAMDLEPFQRIHPCGYLDLATVDMRRCGVATDWADVAVVLAQQLQALLN